MKDDLHTLEDLSRRLGNIPISTLKHRIQQLGLPPAARGSRNKLLFREDAIPLLQAADRLIRDGKDIQAVRRILSLPAPTPRGGGAAPGELVLTVEAAGAASPGSATPGRPEAVAMAIPGVAAAAAAAPDGRAAAAEGPTDRPAALLAEARPGATPEPSTAAPADAPGDGPAGAGDAASAALPAPALTAFGLPIGGPLAAHGPVSPAEAADLAPLDRLARALEQALDQLAAKDRQLDTLHDDLRRAQEAAATFQQKTFYLQGELQRLQGELRESRRLERPDPSLPGTGLTLGPLPWRRLWKKEN